ncbi:unnamed protein product [Plutella xylostella]|uniref:(diamondback moth) hypothetical protein n=1 Tax=Plutella xylostella TaxID=51655 RepID=A0A8S4GF38_PLUXY|nr:unnamed protein product [Plutella xylostella]
MRTVLLVSLFLFGAAYSSDLENETVPTEESLKRGLSSKCGLREPSSCIALELVGYVDRVLRTATIQLSDDVMIVDESSKCGFREPSSCIALELVGYVDRVLRTTTIQLSDDVMIVDER